MNIKEKIFKLRKLQGVIHGKFDPEGAGFIKLYLIPAKFSIKSRSSILILNSRHIIPLAPAWTILVANFIFEINKYNNELNSKDLKEIEENVIKSTRKIYPNVKPIEIKEDLEKIIQVFRDIAYDNKSNIDIGQLNLAQFSKYMKGPVKAHFILTPFLPTGSRMNNSSCLYCTKNIENTYTKEFTVDEYKKAIDILRKNSVPELIFDGDNILTKKDELLELLEYTKKDFITCIKTKGARLTKELCKELYDNGLDELVITLYSHDKETHNLLSNEENFDNVIIGIKNAISVGINVVIDTPLCSINSDYIETLKFINSLGVRYVNCGLLNVNRCLTRTSDMKALSKEQVLEIFNSLKEYIKENKIEITFNTHGYIPIEKLREYGINYKLCRACVNEITINIDGNVFPCYNCLNKDKILGNILKDKWKAIWNGTLANRIRKEALSERVKCPSSNK